MTSKRYYMVSGMLEPIHLKENERELLVEGMQTSVAKIVQEVYKSTEICKEAFGMISQDMKRKIE